MVSYQTLVAFSKIASSRGGRKRGGERWLTSSGPIPFELVGGDSRDGAQRKEGAGSQRR
jgi:hypothetical protein